MKIISNFKDYYDFMVNKYGIDPKVVYERVQRGGMYVPDYIKISKERTEEWVVHFCGKKYYVYYAFGDWYYGKGVLDLDETKYPEKWLDIYTYKKVTEFNTWKSGYEPKKSRWFGTVRGAEKIHGGPTDINEKENCPIVLTSPLVNFTVLNPRLSDLNFAKVIPPEDAFITISNWLTRENPIIDYRTDKEKVISHGFDPKTSFRKM